MNHCKARDERIKQQKIAEEEKKRKLAEWEELQKARSAQVAKDWYAQMQEANGLWKQAVPQDEMYDASDSNDPNYGLHLEALMHAAMEEAMLDQMMDDSVLNYD